MASSNKTRLAEILGISSLDKGGPFGGSAAVGLVDDFPIAVSWTKLQKQSTAALLLCFKKGSLKLPPDAFRDRVASSPGVLAAMDKKKLSGGELKSIAISDSSILFYWYYNFRAPDPDSVAGLLRALLKEVKEQAQPVGSNCEHCEKFRGELYCVDGTPTVICAGCREKLGEEDRQRIAAYEALASNPLMGTFAGAIASVVMAAVWGGVAYLLKRIFLYGAILIGIVIAWAVNKGMGKVNLYGRILSVILTVASVVMGDYLFILLSAREELGGSINLDLVMAAASHFFEIEFSDASGFLSLLFGVLGAIYILYTNRPPVAKRSLVPVLPAGGSFSM